MVPGQRWILYSGAFAERLKIAEDLVWKTPRVTLSHEPTATSRTCFFFFFVYVGSSEIAFTEMGGLDIPVNTLSQALCHLRRRIVIRWIPWAQMLCSTPEASVQVTQLSCRDKLRTRSSCLTPVSVKS
ncbi:hypothetical protein PsYK624_036180 [Phanerochaete sordida]|uniref:Uncharacterized protein n=1 Tax=Phanerochaete sordida TaxID=48140 RepID=A0A9P3L9V6_9APHY|nr:hypothetical protein PsYK624_036180 [Phanerochaete sordida]